MEIGGISLKFPEMVRRFWKNNNNQECNIRENLVDLEKC